MTTPKMIKTRTVISQETKYEIIIKHQDGVIVTKLSNDYNY
jgi:hypothetical protein